MGSRRRRPADEGRLLQLVYYLYLGASRFALAVPEGLAYWLAEAAGSLAARVSAKRHVVARNLSRVVGKPSDSPEVRRLVVAAFRSYARYWLETFRIVREDRDFFLERFRNHGIEKIEDAIASGKGVVVVVGHLGNWDAAGAWFGARGGNVVSIAEVLRPRRIFEFFLDHRRKLGIQIFPAESGVTDRLVESVHDGVVVAILGDRDFKGTGPEVELFGEKTTFPPGPASVALRSGAAMMVAGIYGIVLPDGRHGWEAIISDPLELPSTNDQESIVKVTRAVAREMERFIAARPEEWHVFHPVWPSDRA